MLLQVELIYLSIFYLSMYLSIYLYLSNTTTTTTSTTTYYDTTTTTTTTTTTIAADKHWSKKDYLLLTLCLPSGSLLIIFFTAFLWSWVALFRRFCCRLGFEELLSIYVSIYLSQRSI